MKRKEIKKIVIGITGSVGAALMPEVILYLRLHLADEVYIMVSKSAKKFLSPYAAKIISGNEVIDEIFTDSNALPINHIQTFENADVFLIMPATANTINKIACGIADEIIPLSALSSNVPIVIVPSMNGSMWHNQITANNVEKLRSMGIEVLNPVKGYEISTLQLTDGCMPQFNTIIDKILEITRANQDK